MKYDILKHPMIILNSTEFCKNMFHGYRNTLKTYILNCNIYSFWNKYIETLQNTLLTELFGKGIFTFIHVPINTLKEEKNIHFTCI